MEFGSGNLACRVMEECPEALYRCLFMTVNWLEDGAGSLLLSLWAGSDIATQACRNSLSGTWRVTVARYLSAPGEGVEDLTAGLANGTP